MTRLGSIIEFNIIVKDGGVRTCLTDGIATNPINTLRHVVLTVDNGDVFIRSEGSVSHAVPLQNSEFDPTMWIPYSAPLKFATPTATNGWTGTFHMVAMYDRVLSAGEVAANQAFGPPNSLPIHGTTAATAAEDSTLSLYP